jgi:glycosyltransferase involved in cell wall biosynthesis
MSEIDALFLTRYGRKGASSRYRFLQYFSHFRVEGVSCTFEPLLGNEYLTEMYENGNRNLWLILRGYFHRLWNLLGARQYDIVILEKELFPYAPALFERLLAQFEVPYIVDYDDAVFHNYDRSSNPLMRKLLGRKIDVVMREADAVVAGNEYLAARAHNTGASRVEIIPTVIDLNRYPHVPPKEENPFVIGWIGSPTTAQYVKNLAPVLKEVSERRDVRVILVGSGSINVSGVPLEVREWSEETEIDDISSFDVGIMPLEDTPWERGKCGFKLIQYMGCGKPVIASPVGMNADIVTDQHNGLHAETDEEWIESLIQLADNRKLATEMGNLGRELVANQYSLQTRKSQWIDLLREIV